MKLREQAEEVPSHMIYTLAFQVKRPGFEDVELEDGWYRGKANSRGLRHGQGIMYYLNGDRYQGKWSLGRR